MIEEVGPNIDISMFPAGQDFVDSDGIDDDYKYKVVCLNSDGEIVYPTAITDIPFGILIEGAEEGDYVTVRTFGVVPVKANAIIALPALIGIGSDGGVIDGRIGAAVATNKVFGQLLESADSEDDYVTAFVNFANMPIKA